MDIYELSVDIKELGDKQKEMGDNIDELMECMIVNKFERFVKPVFVEISKQIEYSLVKKLKQTLKTLPKFNSITDLISWDSLNGKFVPTTKQEIHVQQALFGFFQSINTKMNSNVLDWVTFEYIIRLGTLNYDQQHQDVIDDLLNGTVFSSNTHVFNKSKNNFEALPEEIKGILNIEISKYNWIEILSNAK